MTYRPLVLIAPVACLVALAACSEEPQAPDSDVTAADTQDDVLATDTAILPPQDTSGEAPAAVADPAPDGSLAAPAEPEAEPPPPPEG